MKKGKIFQVITALLLAITLVVTGVYHPYLFGEKDNEAQAADDLKEISWEDFNGAEYGKTYSTAWTKFTYEDTSVTTLNNTKFTGRIQFSDNSHIRFGGSNESFGLHLSVIDGKFYLWSDSFDLTDIDVNDDKHYVRPATDFGIASGTFTNEEIELTITMTNVQEKSATVGVWVNDIPVDEEFTITENGVYGASLGNTIGLASGSITVLAPLPPEGLTEIGWRNFGIKSESPYNNHTYVTYAGGESLDGTLFSGDIKMGNTDSSQKSEIRYAASHNGNYGLHICVENGLLYLVSHTMNIVSGEEYLVNSSTYYYAPNFKAGDDFSNATFNLKISTEIEDSNYTFGIWINDIMVGGYFTLTPQNLDPTPGGNQIGLDCDAAGFVIVYPEEVTYKDITWKDFTGNISGPHTTITKFTYKHGDTLNKTRFTGQIQLAAGSGIRYGGAAENFGLHIYVDGDGKLLLKSDTFNLSDDLVTKSFDAQDFGITSGTFANEEIKLTITMADVTPQSATVGVWVNDKEVDSEFVITGNGLHGGALGNCFGIYDCNSSAPITIPKPLPPTDLTPISWENFGITADTTYESHTAVTYTEGDSLHGTLFSGDITMNNSTGRESEIRYAASEGGSWGLHIQVNGEGKLCLSTETMDVASGSSTTYSGPHDASDFGFADGENFTNTRFNLKISTEIEGYNYTFGVWVNDIMVGDYFTLVGKQYVSGYASYSGGNQIGMQLNKKGTVTAHIGQEEPELTPIDWSDFGVSYGSKYTAHTEVSYTESSLNNTVFEDYVMLTANAEFGYASSTGWDGLFIGLNEAGNLLIRSDACHPVFETSGAYVNATPFEPSAFELTSLVNTKFKLKIETTEMTATTAKFRVWVNDFLVGNDAMIGTITDTVNYAFGNSIGLQRSQNGAIYMPANIAVPEGLTPITWEDFGIAANNTYEVQNGSTSGIASYLASLNNTLFDGDVMMGSEAHIRYGGHADYSGLHIRVANDGQLYLASDSFNFANAGTGYAPELFGLDNFIDRKFNLKVAMTEVTDTTAKVCVWVNDQAVTETFTMTRDVGTEHKTGTYLAFYSGTITPYTMFTKQTGLQTIAFKDFNNNGFNSSGEKVNGAPIENGNYGKDWIQAVYSDTNTTLLDKSFRDTIKMEPHKKYEDKYCYTLQYGGAISELGQHGGIRLSLVGDNLVIHSANGEFSGEWTLYPDKVGLQSFEKTEFQLGIDAVQYKGHVLLWLYFDGECYNNAPFPLINFASQMSNTLMAIAGNGSKEYLEDKFIIGTTMKTLTSVHHDIALGGYKLPTGLTEVSGKTYQGEEINTSLYTGGSSITETGVYQIQYDDGVSLYEQTIYLGLTGDNNCNSVLDSCDLVRLLKQQRITEYTMEEGAEAAADIDNNGYLNEEDIITLRTALVDSLDEDDSVMPIVGFREPTGDLITDEIYELISKAGINTIMQHENKFSTVANSRYSVYEQLTLAQNHNIKITVNDDGLQTNRSSVTATDVGNAVSKYDYFQSYAGLWIVDEPKTSSFGFDEAMFMSEFENLASQAQNAGQEIFANLQPFHKTHGGTRPFYTQATYNYVQYLKEYVETFNPSMISYDYYPFDKDKTGAGVSGDVEGASQYFQNLAMVRYVAQTEEMPFWYTVQAGTNWNDSTTESIAPTTNNCPTEGEFKWNVNTALAFGAKGIQYFPMIQPSWFAKTTGEAPDYERNGLIGADGTPNDWYYYAQEANAQIAAIDHVLMNATNEGLMSTGGYAQSQATKVVQNMTFYNGIFDSDASNLTNDMQAKTPIYTGGYKGATVKIDESNAKYGALTGCFNITGGKYEGKHALYIVNYDPSNACGITVNLGSEKTAIITLNAVTEEQTASTVTKTLGAGEAMLIVY